MKTGSSPLERIAVALERLAQQNDLILKSLAASTNWAESVADGVHSINDSMTGLTKVIDDLAQAAAEISATLKVSN